MYSVPERLNAETYAEYPEALKTAVASNPWIKRQPPGLAAGCFLEGPSFDREGNLWCVDIPNGRILILGKDRKFSVAAEYDGWPNGLKINQDGRVFIADYKTGIMVLDPSTGKVEPYLTEFEGEAFKGVNDLFFGENGDLFFTDQGLTGLQDPSGRVFRLTTDGNLHCVLSGIPSPNGLVLNMKESSLLLAVTRANSIWKLPLLADGTTAKVGNFIQLSGGTGPDGLALDSGGSIAIAHAGKGVVWIFDDTGEPLFRIDTPQGRHPTNLAYGGDDGRTLFITESDSASILQVTLPVPGKPMYSHRGAGSSHF